VPIVKCLSVSQPFADLIVKGKKTVDLRKWNTKFRGEFLIHSPMKIKSQDCKRLGINETNLRTGAIIGKAVIYDVKTYKTKKEWHDDKKHHFASGEPSDRKYGFLLKNAKEFRIPIPCKGKLGFFDIRLEDITVKDKDITSELFDEEYRTQWINHH
jgi:predicted transcriptional regulator